MKEHILRAYSTSEASEATDLWCERDESGKIVNITAASGKPLEFSYVGEWVKFQGRTWRFDKNEGLKPSRQYYKDE